MEVVGSTAEGVGLVTEVVGSATEIESALGTVLGIFISQDMASRDISFGNKLPAMQFFSCTYFWLVANAPSLLKATFWENIQIFPHFCFRDCLFHVYELIIATFS